MKTKHHWDLGLLNHVHDGQWAQDCTTCHIHLKKNYQEPQQPFNGNPMIVMMSQGEKII